MEDGMKVNLEQIYNRIKWNGWMEWMDGMDGWMENVI